MANSLRLTLTQLAASFADDVLKSIRGLSLEELLAATKGTSGGRGGRERAEAPANGGARGRLGRRSASDIAGTVDEIVALLKTHKGGLRSEQIQKQLGLDKRAMARPISAALAAKKIAKKGEKRATTYFAR